MVEHYYSILNFFHLSEVGFFDGLEGTFLLELFSTGGVSSFDLDFAFRYFKKLRPMTISATTFMSF